MVPARQERIRQVVARRQPNLTVILENVHDQHNIGAVLRSCDAVGIAEIFVLYNEPDIRQTNLTLGKRTSAGTRRWIDVHFYQDTAACFAHVRQQYEQVWATHMSEAAVNIHTLDLCQSIALLFGNEHAGVSQAALQQCDGNFLIPMMGMVQSLNISVACAVTLFEAMRQREAAGMYADHAPFTSAQQALFDEYVRRHEEKIDIETILPKG